MTGNSNFDTPGNWAVSGYATNTTPGAGDDIIFDTVATPPPIGMPGGSLSTDCNNMHGPSSGAYNSVQLIGGYVGTVTLSSGFTTENLTFTASAAISQPSSGTDITVTENFNWTKGTLNSSTHLSTLILDGATATIAPASAGTIYCGDNLIFQNSADVEIDPGEIDFANSAEMNVTTGVDLNVVTFTNPDKVKFSGLAQVNVTNAKFGIHGPGTWEANASVLNSGSTIRITGGATVELSKSTKVGQAILECSYYQTGATAELQLRSGTNLQVEKQATIWQGALKTLYDPALEDTVTAQTATLTGNLGVGGGTVTVCNLTPVITTKHFGTFYVTGWVAMVGGTYAPGIDGTTSGKNDHWESGAMFYINSGVGTDPNSATLAPSDPAGVNTVANGIWNIIKSRTAQYTGVFVNPTLQYAAGPPPKLFNLGTSGTPADKLNLDTIS